MEVYQQHLGIVERERKRREGGSHNKLPTNNLRHPKENFFLFAESIIPTNKRKTTTTTWPIPAVVDTNPVPAVALPPVEELPLPDALLLEPPPLLPVVLLPLPVPLLLLLPEPPPLPEVLPLPVLPLHLVPLLELLPPLLPLPALLLLLLLVLPLLPDIKHLDK